MLQKTAVVLAAGGEKRIAKQHAAGKMTARERIASLLDENSFVELDPDREPLPYMNLAECYSLLKEYDKAIEMYERVLQFRPNSERVKEDIAKLQVKKGDYDKDPYDGHRQLRAEDH